MAVDFARAAGPHDGDELAGRDLEVDAFERQQFGGATHRSAW
jgi:hypothetical protein